MYEGSVKLSSVTRQIIVELHIGADEFVRLYSGAAHAVVARAQDGQTVRFPANALRPFVAHDGVHGTFILLIDDRNKLRSINKAG